MLGNVRKYFYERRRGIATTVGVVGALYLAGRYVRERLEEMREQALQEKTARENLRRRFQQNQQDCTFTILALLPTLGDRILEEMDVESVTFTLQLQSKSAKARSLALGGSDIQASSAISLNTEQPSVTSSAELSMPTSAQHNADSSIMREDSRSWVEQFTAESVGSSASDAGPPAADAQHIPGSPGSSSGVHLSDSVTSASVSLVSGSDSEPSPLLIESLHSGRSDISESHLGATIDGAPMSTKSKAELWREVKILTFTRTLTILYSTTLLSLFTHIQLNLLGRYKYVQSVLDLEKEEKLKEQQSFQASVSNLFWGGGDLAGELELESLETDEVADTLGLFGTGRTSIVERKYLTLSWWLIHVGWRGIGDRVRTAVEDVLDGVPLKTKLGMEDLERLIRTIRQKVEFDASAFQPGPAEGDGSILPRRISFLPSLIPATPDRLKDVLVQGGLPHGMLSLDDTPFLQLVDETREFVSSADFGRVLETCLDQSTNILLDGLRRTLFPDASLNTSDASPEKIMLAGLLPGVARWSHSAIHGIPNEFVENLAEVRELAGFSAIIYSSYVDTFR